MHTLPEEAKRPHTPPVGACILIVDDQPVYRRVLELMLEGEGYVVTQAASGEEALVAVAQRTPDLILLDVKMPGIDGYHVVARLKADAATTHIPVIIVSGNVDGAEVVLGLQAGAEDVLRKPVERAELCMRVRNLLRLKAYSDYVDRYSQALEEEVRARTIDLRHERDRAQHYLETAGVMLFALDREGCITMVNRYACNTLGWTAAEMQGQNAFDLCSPARERQLMKTNFPLVLAGRMSSFENHVLVRGGAERRVEWRVSLLRDDAGEVVGTLSSGTDITDQRALEKQHQQGQKMEAIGQLASGVAHDFNNLLTVILGFGEMMAAEAVMPERQRQDLDEIMKAARRASGLTTQLLAFSRQQVLKTAPMDVNGLIRDMTGMLERLIEAHITTELRLDAGAPLVLADRSQMEQVVMNLVMNARDAMPAGGQLLITTDVVLSDDSPDDDPVVPGRYVMLSVRDSGTGISPEVRQRLFEPFFTTKKTGEGTGLGLSTAYGIVRQSGGYLRADSTPGAGATFKVYLPVALGAMPSDAAVASVPTSPPVATATLLLVEDEPGVRRLSKRILTNAGYEVLEAANGDEAETRHAHCIGTIDLVVTDVVMPGCGGPELLRRLRARAPMLRALYMSGYTEQSVARQIGLDSGLAFVRKPFTAAELLRQVREALETPAGPLKASD
jgi:PAS domain S-box-containing protein